MGCHRRLRPAQRERPFDRIKGPFYEPRGLSRLKRERSLRFPNDYYFFFLAFLAGAFFLALLFDAVFAFFLGILSSLLRSRLLFGRRSLNPAPQPPFSSLACRDVCCQESNAILEKFL